MLDTIVRVTVDPPSLLLNRTIVLASDIQDLCQLVLVWVELLRGRVMLTNVKKNNARGRERFLATALITWPIAASASGGAMLYI
jgi:hypothetical protein